MVKKRTGQQTKTLILDACGAILRRDGARCLTLDAVALEAGLSKGGLLYHFPNKETLLTALFDQYMSPFDNYLATAPNLAEADYLIAYMDATIEQIEDTETIQLIASLFAAGEEFPQLHAQMQDRYQSWQRGIAQGMTDPVSATAIRMAIDGLWFAAVHNYAPPNAEMRTAIVKLLRTFIERD